MPGRIFQGQYRFGFNGKEKDDEIQGSGNSLDFGDRIYDSRKSTFSSVDPMFKSFASVSNYSYAGNRPISMVDLKGEKETYYLTIINEKAEKTTYEVVNDNKVEIQIHDNGDFGVSVRSYDVRHDVTVYMNKDGNIETSQTTYTLRENGPVDAFYDKANQYSKGLENVLRGNGGSQPGGFRVVSINGKNVGSDPTKMKVPTQNLKDLQRLNYDDISDALLAINSSVADRNLPEPGIHNLPDAADNAKGVNDANNERKHDNLNEKQLEEQKPKREMRDSCTACHDTGPAGTLNHTNNGKSTIVTVPK